MFHIFAKQWQSHQLQYLVSFSIVLLLSGPLPAAEAAQEPLTLTEATQRALAENPELRVFQWRFEAIHGTRETAALRPAYRLGLEAENLTGSGQFSGVDSAEFTLSLSSVIELGGKRRSRIAVADSRYALAQAEREAKALDLLGLVTQTFVATLSLQEKLAVAKDAVQLAEQSFHLVSERVQRGAAPKAERLRAEAVLKQAQMQQDALSAELESRKFALASLWKADRVDFGPVDGDLFNFEEPSSFEVLYEQVTASPAIQVFASDERVRNAEIALARSQSTSNVRWSLGLRRYEDTGDSALTAGVSVPLFSRPRNRGEVQSALARREMVQYQREATLLAIRARLFEAWQTYQQSVDATSQMRAEVLPALKDALEQTRQAYEGGRYSYVDWVTAQKELLDARMAAIDSATTALLNQALIEQLTAEPLGLEATSSENGQAGDANQ
ncbi:TolC family protein [Gilvimarinus sp. F26214L]|uniref:TolC family protein n=1 Tax=Gilvimarinus sp. DZF01 TaxID=3461371 RepID=UPI0040452780